MKNPALQEGILVKRYKQFLADIKIASGETITVHCPNPGSMLSCSEAGSRVMFSKSDNPKRKYPHTWELIFTNNVWVGVNTLLPNRLLAESIRNNQIPELTGYTEILTEVKYGKNSRIDVLLKSEEKLCYVEVKNVSLVRDNIASFPDAVTRRGTKHLHELVSMVEQGHRAVMFFLVQRSDANSFQPAEDIDPVYAQTLRSAFKSGVEILVYQASVSPEEISLLRPLPYTLYPA